MADEKTTPSYYTARGLCKLAGVSTTTLNARVDAGLLLPAAYLSTGGALYTADQALVLVSINSTES